MIPHTSNRVSPQFFVFIIITLLCAFSVRDQRPGESRTSPYFVYRIRFEYFGMDAPEMEKLIAIPLEEEISALGNIAEIRTVCEYGLSETTVFFNRSQSEKKKIYLALRDTVDSRYRELPASVQKPRIYEAAAGKHPFFSAAIQAGNSEGINLLRTYLEQNLKGELENLEGIGEVSITGGSMTEVHIKFDPDRGAETGIDPADLGTIVQDANVIIPGGILYQAESNKTVNVKTRITNLEEIKKLPVKAGEEISTLEYFAHIGFAPREQREILTLNGEECAGISITAIPGANLISLSLQIREILATLKGFAPESLQILRDEGKLQREMLRAMCIALIQSFAVVIIILPLFFKSPRTILLIILFLPVCVVWSLGVLRILNIGIDQYVLSGVSISLGLVIDPWLVVASSIKKVKNLSRGIAASVFTTLLVVFPLCFLDSIAPGIRQTALTIMAMVGSSLILGLFFFPGFLQIINKKTSESTTLFRPFHRTHIRMGYALCVHILTKRNIAITVYGTLSILAVLLFFHSGKDLNMDFRLPLLYVSAEFESGKSAAAVNRDLEELSRNINLGKGVRFVRLESRNGSGEFEIGFDEKAIHRRDLADRIAALAPLLGDGFLYVPDADAGFTSGIYEVEITAVSENGTHSRDLAREGATIAGNLSETVQTVLNFKEPPALIAFKPDRELLAKSGLTVRDLASSLRWLLFGPVIGKWLQDGRETDIRIMGQGLAEGSRSQLGNIALPSPAGPIRLETLGIFEEIAGEGAIYRRGGKRVSYFTVHLAAKSASGAAALLRENLNREQGQGSGFLLSRELELLNAQYSLVFIVFAGSALGIFLVLLGMTEKWKSALRISSIIPVSCALPLLVKFFCRSPLEMGDAVALVVVAGLAVNNGVFIEESAFSAVPLKVRDKILPILATSLTGIIGAIPLALLGGEGFSAALSRGILWGIAGSLLASLFLFPALYPKRGKG